MDNIFLSHSYTVHHNTDTNLHNSVFHRIFMKSFLSPLHCIGLQEKCHFHSCVGSGLVRLVITKMAEVQCRSAKTYHVELDT